MALGRHSAGPVKRQKPANELLAWGVFISFACLASMWVLELDSGPGLVLSVLPAAAFGVVWILNNGAVTQQPAGAHSAASPRRAAAAAAAATPAPATPAPATTAPSMTPEPAVQTAPDQGRSAHIQPPPDSRSNNSASRWVQEFGPPDTGPLPVQTYRRNRGSGVFAGSVEQRSDGRQWSHSRA